METENIFAKRNDGGRPRSIFGQLPPRRRNQTVIQNGRFNIREIANQVRDHGSVEFEFDQADLAYDVEDEEIVKPPRPFQRRFGRDDTDSYDIRDANAPQEENTDSPSLAFHRGVRQATGYPVDVDSLERLTEDGGVRKRILKDGTGAPDQVTDGCRVWIHYDTYLDNWDGKLVLRDSTTDHEMATSLEIGREGLPGLQIGLMTMRRGEVAEFSLSPAYAYGENGVLGFIGKGQHLRIIVELKEVKRNHRKPMSFMTDVEKQRVEFKLEDVLKEADDLQKAGNAKFEKIHYRDAADRYNWALDLLTDYRKRVLANGKQGSVKDKSATDPGTLVDHKAFKLYSNLALAFFRMENFEEAEAACETALNLRSHPVDLEPKVMYRQALAMYKQGKFHEATGKCMFALRSTSWGHTEFRDLKYRAENAAIRLRQKDRLERQKRTKEPLQEGEESTAKKMQ